MRHVEAVESMATERYLLNEMSPDEREAFEEHFFDCPVCADDVKDGAALIDSGRAVVKQRRGGTNIVTWFPLAAALALAFVIGYQNTVTIPRLHHGPPAAAIALLQTADFREMRAAAPPSLAANQWTVVDLEGVIPPEPPYARYEATIHRANGTALPGIIAISAEQAHNSAPAVIRPLPPDHYVLVVHGIDTNGNRVEVVHHPFDVR